MEQPKRFELVINIKTAKAMGFEVPSSLIGRVHDVVE
jgi:putative ABC transport system substrate-binding protein